MQLILLEKFNNYFNRKIIKYDTVSSYINNRRYYTINSVNFNPNDGVQTQQIINWNEQWQPDYLLVVDGENINSRWFIGESKRTRGQQYDLTLKRDVVADFFNGIIEAPCFIEKATLNEGDPFIFNSEGMTFNQIKKSEILLNDTTNCQWIVGYVVQDQKHYPYTMSGDTEVPGNFTATINMELPNAVDFDDLPFKDYLTGELDSSFNVVKPDFKSLSYLISGGGSSEPVKRIEYNNLLNQVITYQATYLEKLGMNIIFLSPLANLERQVVSETNQYIPQYKNIIKESLLNYLQENNYIGLINEIMEYNGKYVKAGTNYYKLNITYYEKDITTNVNQDLNNTGLAYNSINLLQSIGTRITAISKYYDLNNDTSVRYNSEGYEVRVILEPTDIAAVKLYFSGARNKNVSQPFDMFAIPYIDGTIGGISTTKQIALSAARAIATGSGATGSSGSTYVYDIQLLPYCPCRNLINEEGFSLQGATYDSDFSYITDNEGNINGFICWSGDSNFTFDIDKRLDIVESVKIDNECDTYRLCSPNYNGVFEFSVAKNGGVDTFNVDCSYKPYIPYIHVNPNFGGLYGRDFDDNRGLICGGDFSLTIINNTFSTYELQNKNYQNIFNREIQNMDFNNKIQLSQDITNAITGTVQGGAFGSVLGSTAGGAIASGIAGIADVAVNQLAYRETKKFKTDMYNYNLGNIRALPNSISKTSSININNRPFPFIEYYSCTEEEKDALKNKLYFNGMTVMRIGTILEFMKSTPTFIKGQLIRIDDISDDYHITEEIYSEINKGVYI